MGKGRGGISQLADGVGGIWREATRGGVKGKRLAVRVGADVTINWEEWESGMAGLSQI